ncbi:TonB-dependent receptor [Catenovulum agarivorans DS-2]|uniref:TonB-dependent receptor n=1 Tax=Catenovulum agarivorans DS-2 TaxID=1328313 RepID=W7R236_9ALTE|nr:TonB-dependent receptor [Catenovulum agarivorans]EWH11685.1 TonB-dependent receptor [Catenovulum agarivorans DS-2]
MTYTLSPITKAIIITGLIASSVTSVSAENADNEVEVIEIQGDYRSQNIHTAPVSVSVLGADTIDFRAANHLDEILNVAPNVNFNGGSNRARFIQIRGLGASSEYDAPTSFPVGLYLDDVDYSPMGGAATLFDTKQVEIYRGPQGTRFGANALAGLIYVKSNEPTSYQSGQLKLGLANYNSQDIGIAYSNGLTDNWSYRVSAYQHFSDGFMENIYLDKTDTNGRDELSLRGKLRYDNQNDIVWDFTLSHIDIDNGYDAFSLNNDRTTLSDQPGFDKQESSSFSSNLAYQLTAGIKLHAIANLVDTDTAYGFDEDWSYVGIAPDSEYSSTDYYFHDKSNHSIEIRLNSTDQGRIFNQSTEWVVGVYAQNAADDLVRQYTWFANDFTSEFNNDKRAIFTQLDSQLSASWKLTLGARFEAHDFSYANNQGVSSSKTYDMFGGKAVIGYRPNSSGYYYASINRGYMAGGGNIDGDFPEEQRLFKPEYLTNYELGYKYQNNGLSYAVTAFYMDRQDVQLTRYVVADRNDAGDGFSPLISNADTGYSQGLEFEIDYLLTAETSVYGSFGWLKAMFDHQQKVPTEIEGEYKLVTSSRELSQAPSYTYLVGAVHTISSDLWVSAEVEGKDDHYFSDDYETRSYKTNIVNATVNYQAGDWVFKLWARNLFDKTYPIQGFYFGNDPRDGYADKHWYQYAEPRRVGLTAELEF